MVTQTGVGRMTEDMELLRRVSEADGQLLRVERYAGMAESNAAGQSTRGSHHGLVPGLLLTFDVGRVLVWANPGQRRLECEHIRDVEDVPKELVCLDEEEPWWRVLGSPLARVVADGESPAYRLQFRRDERNPRFIWLIQRGDCVRIRMETPASGRPGQTD